MSHERFSIVEADRIGPTAVALAGVLAWLLGELIARWGLASSLYSSGLVENIVLADSISVLAVMPVVSALVGALAIVAGRGPGTWGYDRSPRSVAVGVGAGVLGFVLTVVAGLVDQFLFAELAAAGEGMTGALAAAPTAALVALVAMNVLAAPVLEEFVWRGVVQSSLTDRYGPRLAIPVVAVAFAAKHVVVDLSVARVTTLLVLAGLLGVVKYRWSTTTSTVAHFLVNGVATGLLVATAL